MSKTRLKLLAVGTAFVFIVTQSAFAASPAPVKGEHGMVVTAQHLASDIGVEVMKDGGNAVDAAVAVGYALAVAHPSAGNIGGGGFMTIRFKDGTSTFLDFRERAPLAATKAMYLDKDGNPIKGASLDGYLAIGVPGSVAGLDMAREKYGTRPRAQLMAPAISLAHLRGVSALPGAVDAYSATAPQVRNPISAMPFHSISTPGLPSTLMPCSTTVQKP